MHINSGNVIIYRAQQKKPLISERLSVLCLSSFDSAQGDNHDVLISNYLLTEHLVQFFAKR